MTAGLGGHRTQSCVALAGDAGVLGVCAQERATRSRGAGVNASGLPDEAVDCLLDRLGQERSAITRYVVADADHAPRTTTAVERVDHHLAHASTAFLTSPFASAVVVVVDEDAPKVSVWRGDSAGVRPVEWPWRGPGFSDVHRAAAAVFGFDTVAGQQQLEALGRLCPRGRDEAFTDALRVREDGFDLAAGWLSELEAVVATKRGPSAYGLAVPAGAFEARLADLVVEWLGHVKRLVPETHLCVGGSFFYNSAVNRAVRASGMFEDVFVPVDPGNGGVAVGAALAASSQRALAAPYLGPSYDPIEIKATLDNCKLRYEWATEDGIVRKAVDALIQGRLVGWFDGAMEWGPRSLGARSIVANPFAPYVLENLNRFLKQRAPWRGYGLSATAPAVAVHFDGPAVSRYMECDFLARSPETFGHVLPMPGAAIRVHTVGDETPGRFRRLLEAFGAATGLPFLVNTSFNGRHEPVVCHPADAVRVFYGTGMDLLIMDRFVIEK